MSHPFAEHRQHKVERSRVSHIAKGYAAGGAVHSDAAQDAAMIKRMVRPGALKMDGGAAKHRLDRARGGRTKHKSKGTNVNVIVAPQSHPGPSGPIPIPMPAPGPASPAPMPVAARPPMPVPPPGVGGPPMPIRSRGGRNYKRGGAVKSGPAFDEGRKNGTPVQHADGKDDGKDIGRGKPITYATGGKVEAPKGSKGMAPHLPGGAGGGLARLAKQRMAKHG